jgi:hypothetical protein
VIGQLCYSDREHISALYDAGAKDHFEILAIHAYGKTGTHVDMEQVIESHAEMAARGDPDIPILVTEGWSCFPLPASIEHDPAFRKGPRPYTQREVEHYRGTVLDGWRNLTTPRPGEYDPAWLLGARYFVLNDHWGGRHWAERAKPDRDENGNLRGFFLDGYRIGTTDPDYIKPFMRPWGLIDIDGKPKGDTVYAFPPRVPGHTFTATLRAELPDVPYHPQRKDWTAPEVKAETPYRVTVEFRNDDALPLTDVTLSIGEKTPGDAPEGYAFAFVNGRLHRPAPRAEGRRVTCKILTGAAPATLAPGTGFRLEAEIRFSADLATTNDRGWRNRVRPYADVYALRAGRPVHFDAWLPRVVVAGGDR